MLSAFIQWPLLAVVPAGILLALGAWSHRRLALAAGFVWLLYFPYELGMKARVLCTGECNIRVDLLLIYPVLAAVSLIGLLSALRARRSAATRLVR
jgi:hypothetical protein